MSRSRTSSLLSIIAVVALAIVGFALLARQGGTTGSSATAAGESTTTTAGASTDGPAALDTATDAADPSATETTGAPAAPADTTPTTFARDAEGRFLPTGAPQGAYPTYLGGDFDDPTPNGVASAGVDENGCDANYAGTCVPPGGAGCAELGAVNIEVVLGDPYGLDPDGDGIACEDESIVRTPHGEGTPEPRD